MDLSLGYPSNIIQNIGMCEIPVGADLAGRGVVVCIISSIGEACLSLQSCLVAVPKRIVVVEKILINTTFTLTQFSLAQLEWFIVGHIYTVKC